jgi:hypothetical protein
METINDIVREIRSRNEGCVPLDGESSHPLAEDMLKLADRIEAAVKALEAARDNWRRQALDEDARANEAQSVYNKEETCKSIHNGTSYSVQFSHDKIRWEDMLDTFATADEAKQWGIKHRSINSKIYNDWLIRVIAITTRTEVVYGYF